MYRQAHIAIAASRVLVQIVSICCLIFSTSSLFPRPSWYGIWASSLVTFLASFLLIDKNKKQKWVNSSRKQMHKGQPFPYSGASWQQRLNSLAKSDLFVLWFVILLAHDVGRWRWNVLAVRGRWFFRPFFFVCSWKISCRETRRLGYSKNECSSDPFSLASSWIHALLPPSNGKEHFDLGASTDSEGLSGWRESSSLIGEGSPSQMCTNTYSGAKDTNERSRSISWHKFWQNQNSHLSEQEAPGIQGLQNGGGILKADIMSTQLSGTKCVN